MEFWGINLTSAACEKEFSDHNALHIRHLTLLEGRKASIKVHVHTEKKSQEKLLGVLTQLTPNARVNVKLNHPVRFVLESEHSATVSIVGNTFPRSLSRALSEVIPRNYLSQWMEGNDITDDENNSWNPAENLEKFIQTMWNETSRPASLQNSNRVVEITEEEEEKDKTAPSAQQPQAAAGEASVNQKKDVAKTKKKDMTTVKPQEALVSAKEGHDNKRNQKGDKFKKPPPSEKDTTATQTAETGVTRTLPGGVSYSVISLGQGKIATVGKRIKVKYQGFLAQTGKQFDHGLLEFTVGAGEMIKGFDLGVRGMLTKEKRKIFIPSPLGYGKQKVGPIPPNSNLIFEVTLISVA